MKLVPVPTPNLEATWTHWWPWIKGICDRSKDTPSDIVRDLRAGVKQVHLLWDEESCMCRGILGTSVIQHGQGGATCHLIWATGKGLQPHWNELLQQVQNYARDHLKCRYFKATARPGWKSTLKAAGFRTSHIVAEKDL